MSKLIWHRDGRGRQVAECGRYAVAVDGYPKGKLWERDQDGYDFEYGDGGEWAAILVEGDVNLDWFPTMREAKAHCQAHADSAERKV